MAVCDEGAVGAPARRFGQCLRRHRRAAGLTQEELAERSGISPRSISGLERGEGATPRRDTLALLERALGLEGNDRDSFEALVVRPTRTISVDEPPARTAEKARPNLMGRALTRFFGRERQLADLG